jgi:hypothetical protein
LRAAEGINLIVVRDARDGVLKFHNLKINLINLSERLP